MKHNVPEYRKYLCVPKPTPVGNIYLYTCDGNLRRQNSKILILLYMERKIMLFSSFAYL